MPKFLLRQLSIGTLFLLGNMLDKQINLRADLTHCTFQIGEGSRYNNRLIHTLISFRLIPFYAPLLLVGRDLRHTRVRVNTH